MRRCHAARRDGAPPPLHARRFLANTIEAHGAMRIALSGREKKDVETTIRFARRLLDNYHPQDVRGETRHSV